MNYIAGLCNVDISVRKQQYYALESAKRHITNAQEKFSKYYSVLKNQINQPIIPGKKSPKNSETEFKVISHPSMTESHDTNDVMSKELNRMWTTGEG